MKQNKVQFLAFLFIFVFLNQSLVVEVQAKASVTTLLKLLSEKNANSGELKNQSKNHRKTNLFKSSKDQSPDDLSIESKLHSIRHKLKEKRAVTKFDPFGITFLVLLGALIVFTIYKYCLNQKIKKHLKWLANEKNKVRVEKYKDRIKEGSILTDFCLSFQKISHLFKSYEVMGKIYERDLSDNIENANNLKSIKFKGAKTPTALTSIITKLGTDIKKKVNKLTSVTVSNMMVEHCYNTFKARESYTAEKDDTKTQTPITKKIEEEYEIINSLEDIVRKVDYSITSVIKDYKENGKEALLWTTSSESTDIANQINDVIEKSDKKEIYSIWPEKEEDWAPNGPLGWGTAIISLADTLKSLKEISDTVALFTDEKAGWAQKIIKTVQWLFKTTNGILSSIGAVQKLGGAAESLDFPFLSLGGKLTSLAESIRVWVAARKEFDAASTEPAKELQEVLTFWDMMDEGIDSLEAIASTLLYILAPFTVGLSQVVNTAIKLVVCWIHIGFAKWKLHVFAKMEGKIVAFYELERKKVEKLSEAFRGKLVAEKCGQVHTLIKAFVEKELDDIESNLEDTQGWINKQAASTQLSDDQVKANVEKIITVVCDSDPENCLEFVNRLKLDLNTITKLNQETGNKVYAISKWAKYGPINSAYLITKNFDPNNLSQDSLLEYVTNSQNKLLINGYYPAFQSNQFDLFICRLCANPFYQLTKVEFDVPFSDLGTKANSKSKPKIVIQESVESFNKNIKKEEITNYFVASFSEINEKDWINFQTSHIIPALDKKGKVQDRYRIVNEVGDYYDTKGHDSLTICVEKLKRVNMLLEALKRNKNHWRGEREKKKRSQGDKSWQNEGSLAILQTIYAQNRYEKGGDLHDFAVLLVSHQAGKLNFNETEKKYINCQSINQLFDFRYHQFTMHLKMTPETLKALETDEGNVPVESLLNGGWAKFAKKEDELSYIQHHKVKSKKKYYWTWNLYSKQLLALFPPENRIQQHFLKETLANMYSLKNELKKEFIGNLTLLYCVNECESFNKHTPLKFTRVVADIKSSDKNKTFVLDFCKLASEPNEFNEFIKMKATNLLKSDTWQTMKKNHPKILPDVCTKLDEITKVFGIENFKCTLNKELLSMIL